MMAGVCCGGYRRAMTAAGWHQDPSGVGQRYWDGQQWTSHYAPPPRVVPQGMAVTVSQPNHGLHAVLTLLTCGLWLPVWAVIAIAGSRRMQVRKQ